MDYRRIWIKFRADCYSFIELTICILLYFMARIRDKDGVVLKFEDRSCKDCSLYPCFQGQENCVSDMAKYGCTAYKLAHDNNTSKVNGSV